MKNQTWTHAKLGNYFRIKHGYAFKGELFSDRGDYVLLTPVNFEPNGGIKLKGAKEKYYTGDFPREFLLHRGDVLVVMTDLTQNAPILGSAAVVTESGRFLHNQRLGLVSKKPGVPWTNEFFFHFFNTKAVRKEIHHSASGVKVRHTSPTKIREVVVSFPTSISEQRAIVSKLNDLDEETQRLESIYQQKLAALDALKKSLLHQAFSGQL